METAEIFGVSVLVGKREELRLWAERCLREGGALATVNATMLDRARRDRVFRHTLMSMTCIPDGIGVRALLLLFGVRTDVLPGVEMLEEILAHGNPRVALIGGRVGVAEGAAEHLLGRNPELNIALISDGYSDFFGMLSQRLCELDAVCLAIGSPRQELLARRLCMRQSGLFCIGLGGTLDVYSGRVRRAPRLFRTVGLEWLWRMMREPRRLLGIAALVRFIFFGIISHPIAPKSIKKNADS